MRRFFEAVGAAVIAAGAFIGAKRVHDHARRWLVWRREARRHRCPIDDDASRPPERQPDAIVAGAQTYLDWACGCGRTHRFAHAEDSPPAYVADVARPAAPEGGEGK